MALNLSLCLFPFYQTPRWRVFSKWAALVEVYMDLSTENLLSCFLCSHFLTGKGLLQSFCGRIKMKSSPLKSSPHIPPAARASAVSSQSSLWSAVLFFPFLALLFLPLVHTLTHSTFYLHICKLLDERILAAFRLLIWFSRRKSNMLSLDSAGFEQEWS